MIVNPSEKLRRLTQIILTEENPSALRAACHELYNFFGDIAGFDDSANGDGIQNGTILSTGKAISPVNAARCLWDFKRTCEFVRAVRAALGTLKNRFAHERIEILYAGCGPFASLIVPLLGEYSPGEINLTLLDYHAASIASVRKVFERLNFYAFNPAFIQTDAARYRHPRVIHLIICETMQNALANETQTANSVQLAPQLADGGIFLPETVSIELCLVNAADESGVKERIDLGRIFELDGEKLRRHPEFEFPPLQLKIPPRVKGRNLRFMLLTKIKIFDSFRLDDYDSGVTYPKSFEVVRGEENADSIEITYINDQKPRFTYKII